MSPALQSPTSASTHLESFPSHKDRAAIWRTIRVGGIPKTELIEALKHGGFMNHTGARYNELVLASDAFSVQEKIEEVNLTVLTARHLGVSKYPRIEHVLDPQLLTDVSRRLFPGYDLAPCLPEDGVQLRLQYTDQPEGEWLAMVGHPMETTDNDRRIWFVAGDMNNVPFTSRSVHVVGEKHTPTRTRMSDPRDALAAPMVFRLIQMSS